MTLLQDLYAFYLEHERCGELDGGVEGDRVWMTCSCGATIVRQDLEAPRGSARPGRLTPERPSG